MIDMKSKFTKVALITFLMIPTFLNGQTDSIRYPIFDVTVETGIFFPKSIDYQDIYNSKSCLNWSIGTKFGTSDWKFLPWIKYSQYQSTMDSVTIGEDYHQTLSAKRNQISFGLINPIEIRNNHFVQLKCGLSYNFISESSTDLYSEKVGYIMSIGYMRRLSEWFTYYADLNYDYAKTDNGYYFKDWGGFLINFGISINLGADETSDK
jgi:hypothetical protein